MPYKFELDEDFEYFLQKFGYPFATVDCRPEIVEKFRGKLPDRLLEYWQEYGFCGFQQ
ncbi:glutamyl-tRNA amidotransferase, partial [Photobacterium aquae]